MRQYQLKVVHVVGPKAHVAAVHCTTNIFKNLWPAHWRRIANPKYGAYQVPTCVANAGVFRQRTLYVLTRHCHVLMSDMLFLKRENASRRVAAFEIVNRRLDGNAGASESTL